MVLVSALLRLAAGDELDSGWVSASRFIPVCLRGVEDFC